MMGKKYIISTLITMLVAFNSFAQESSTPVYRGAGYDVTDSTLIPSVRKEQQRDFLSGDYDFPAKPRNQWELGLSIGAFNVSGDVQSKTMFSAKNPGQTIGYAVHLRKAWGYVLSTRFQYLHGVGSGYNIQGGTGYWAKSANPWVADYSTGNLGSPLSEVTAKPVFYNYKTNLDELSFQVLATINNIKFHKARNMASMYLLTGLGGMFYDTWVDVYNAKGDPYNFALITTKPYQGSSSAIRKEKNNDLRSLFDGIYETRAEKSNTNNWFGKDRNFHTVMTFGAGIQFKMGNKVSFGIEDKWTYTFDDLIDGQRWQEWPQPGYGGAALSRDFDTYNYLSVSLNFSIGKKAVSPLWWMNPLDYGYTSLRHSTGGDDCSIDSDGDGVSDCFDRCPDTPAGVTVDTHGCPVDTDGDGVPDFKDKQLITPTECQPTDADGIGTCPEPVWTGGGITNPMITQSCGDIRTGSVTFMTNSVKLTGAGTSHLAKLANEMRANPSCRVVIMGKGNTSKMDQQRSWDRVNSVINYMADNQGIDRDRFIFQYGLPGNSNNVDFRSAGDGEEGPTNLPPPHPELRRN